MAKTAETKKIENYLWKFSQKMNTYRCFEVSMGISVYNQPRERVDFLTYSSDGIVRCYEIKVSLSDFKSTAKKTFFGDYNYFVFTKELYEKLKGTVELRDYLYMGVGVVVEGTGVVIKPKHKVITAGQKVMIMESMMRSLSREVDKYYSKNPYWI